MIIRDDVMESITQMKTISTLEIDGFCCLKSKYFIDLVQHLPNLRKLIIYNEDEHTSGIREMYCI